MKITKSEISKGSALKASLQVSARFYEDIGTPLSLSCFLLAKYGEWEQLINKDIDPSSYDGIHEFQLDYAAVSFLKKAEFLPTSIDRDAAALSKFMQSEKKCQEVNDRYFSKTREVNPRLSRFIYLAQRKIASILGNVPEVGSLDFKLGPGATSSCKGLETTIGDKLQSKIVATLAAIPYVQSMYTNSHLLSCELKTFVDGPVSSQIRCSIQQYNSLSFVPKSAKISRCICIEPHSMVPLQLGFGSYIRSRLLLGGLDLRKQSELNSNLARIGSIDGSYATIDLSSASDTIAYATVMELLPLDWFSTLSDLRCPYTKVNGDLILNEKFSSMGNGFTFELETLIFYALAKAVCTEGEVSVFGDDIVVPTQYADEVVSLLEYMGFTINKEKTFLSGPFRESCGKDYFLGVNVRPFFMKRLPQFTIDWYIPLNGVRRLASRFSPFHGLCDSRVRRTWNTILGNIPDADRNYGPRDFGDIVIWAPPTVSRTKNWIFYVQIALPVFKHTTLDNYHGSVQLSSVLYGSLWRSPLRGTLIGYRTRNVACPNWDKNDGDWI